MRSDFSAIKRWALPLLCSFTNARAQPGDERPNPVASWSFEDPTPAVARDGATGQLDAISGFQKRAIGVRGAALRLDGYTTELRRPAALAPKFTDGMTLECWIALEAFPWGPCSIIAQADEEESILPDATGMIDLTPENTPRRSDPSAGFSLEVDSEGFPSFGLRLGGTWVVCRSPVSLPLLRWSHLAVTYAPANGDLNLFINGQLVATAPGHGAFAAATTDLRVGRNPVARPIDQAVRLGPPARYGVEGCVDEVRIFDRALDRAHVEHSYGSASPPADTGLRPARLPEIPGPARPFGAYHTRLAFAETWDSSRRDGADADVVVLFGERPWKYVFWRGANYVPHWVNEQGLWYNNEFNETWGGGALGCAEPMSDKQNRFSRVSIIENTPARVVVHWRYALIDSRYRPANADPLHDWGDWTDEYHILYPDGIGIRKVRLWSSRPADPHEFQESIVLVPAGRRPEDVLATEAVTLANMRGETFTYSWADEIPETLDRPPDANVQVINLRAGAKPFLVVSDEAFQLYGINHSGPQFRPMRVEIDRTKSIFPWWDHWPVAQIPSDGRRANHRDRIGHSSVTSGLEWRDWEYTANSRTRVMLHGLTELSASELATVAPILAASPARCRLRRRRTRPGLRCG